MFENISTLNRLKKIIYKSLKKTLDRIIDSFCKKIIDITILIILAGMNTTSSNKETEIIRFDRGIIQEDMSGEKDEQ